MFRSLVRELCRVTKTTIILIEDIGTSRDLGGEGSWIGRQIDTYKSTLAENNFELSDSKFLNLKASRFWYNLVYCRLFKLYKKRKEGEPIGIIPRVLIGLPLPITRLLDKLFTDEQDLAKMTFYRV